MTLRELADKYPEWLDLPITIANGDRLDWLDGSAIVYSFETEEDGETVKVLVFSGN